MEPEIRLGPSRSSASRAGRNLLRYTVREENSQDAARLATRGVSLVVGAGYHRIKRRPYQLMGLVVVQPPRASIEAKSILVPIRIQKL